MSRAAIADGVLYPSVVAVSDSLGLPIGRLRRVLTAASRKIDGHTVSYAEADDPCKMSEVRVRGG